MTTPATPSARRADLDWIRVMAFGLLILFHTALVYSPYDWHVQSEHRLSWMPQLLTLTGPWRLTLLFLVSGAAMSFLTARRTPGQVLKARFERLGPPLLMGVLLLVSIQSWIEAMDNGWWGADYLGWLGHEFGPEGLMDGVPFNHLWFVNYIAAYSVVVVLLMLRPGLIERLAGWLAPLVAGARVVWVPLLYLVAIRLTLYPLFGSTNALVGDWYNHAQSLGAFLFGFLLARHEPLWQALEHYRRLTLFIALAVLPVLVFQAGYFPNNIAYDAAKFAIQATYQWAVIATILGYGSRYLRQKDGPVLRYLTDAVFPLYLAHQTILVVAVWLIRPAGLAPLLEATILGIITFGGSLLIYEVVRRVGWLRPVWGLKPFPPARPPAPFTGRRRLLMVGATAPLLVLIVFLVSVAAYPGFDHASQYLSELGGADARYPEIFNVGVFISGVMAALTGIGIGWALMALTGARITGLMTAAAFLLAGYGLSASSLYPWPDPRHMVISLGLGIQIAPLLILWGLRERRDVPRLKAFLISAFAVMAVLTLFTKHLVLPGTVNDLNVGWWETAYATVLIGWAGVAAVLLERAVRHEATNRGSVTIPA
ncbi:acyltransferase family protein [Brevundimonas aveniformis]|uniref:acyltransferase family protein n=1 Tax=Brevundimonas aveniformis TaxID=370977 RepID=UPI001FE03223|nr:acyltransferase family protein [Brevundimonas aveniformis]